MSSGRFPGDQLRDIQILRNFCRLDNNNNLTEEEFRKISQVLNDSIKDMELAIKTSLLEKALILFMKSNISNTDKEKYNIKKALIKLVQNMRSDFNKTINHLDRNSLLFLIKERLLIEEFQGYSYCSDCNSMAQILKIEGIINKFRRGEEFSKEENASFLEIVNQEAIQVHITDASSPIDK